MKILHILPSYKPAIVYGGPVFSVSALCENLAKAGHEVCMYATTANGATELNVPKGVPQQMEGVQVTYFPRWTGDHTHFSPALLWAVWRNCCRFDAVHVHSWWNIPALGSVLICRLRGVRPMLSPRGMFSGFSFSQKHSLPKKIFHRTLGQFLLKSTRLHLTTEAEKRETPCQDSESFVLPNFIVTGEKFALPEVNNQPFTLLALSRIHPVKNLENLFKAMSKLSTDYRLRLAGTGEVAYMKQLQNLANKLGIAQKIEWLGEISGDEKYRCYASADLFVLASVTENFANVVIEALSTGVPVLVTNKVGLSDYVKNKHLGWVCDTTPEGIAAALRYIIEAEEERRSIRREAPGIIAKDFAPAALTEQYVQRYRRLSTAKSQ